MKTNDGKWEAVTLEQKELAAIEKVSSQHCLEDPKQNDVWRVRMKIPKNISKHISSHFFEGHPPKDWRILVLPGCEKSLAQAFADTYVHPEWRSLKQDLIRLKNQPTPEIFAIWT